MREWPEQPNPPSTQDDLLTAEQQNLTLYLQNVQGISGDGKTTRKAACKRAELKQMLQRASGNHPHLVVLTDHKYARTQDSLKRLLHGYQVHLNPVPSSATNGYKEPRYGVVIAVTQPLCEMGTVQNIPLHNETLGQYITHVLIELPESTPLHVLGVYCPPNGEAKKVRDSIY
jgi:hypothetical protein